MHMHGQYSLETPEAVLVCMQNTQRVIAARNKQRLDTLKEQQPADSA